MNRDKKLRQAAQILFIIAVGSLLTGTYQIPFIFWMLTLFSGIASGNLHKERSLFLKGSSIGFVLSFLVIMIISPFGVLSAGEIIIGSIVTIGGATVYVIRVTNAQEWFLTEGKDIQ